MNEQQLEELHSLILAKLIEAEEAVLAYKEELEKINAELHQLYIQEYLSKDINDDLPF